MATVFFRGPEDEALIAAAIGGDQRAFGVLYARYTSFVIQRLRRYAPHTPDLDDLRQLVFARLFAALPRFRRESTFSTFLSAIVRNVAFDHLRKLHRSPLLSYQDLLPELEDDCMSPEECVENAESIRALQRNLLHLSARCRLAVALVMLEGRTPREAAVATGTSTATIRARVARARRALIKAGKD